MVYDNSSILISADNWSIW